MKDDPENNETVFYGHQQIPNINEFMPRELLLVMDSLHCLHYGEEPPKLEGSFKASDLRLILVKKIPTSHWTMVPTSQLGIQFIKLFEQHFGISKMQFWNKKGTPENPPYYVETSSTDSTIYYVNRNPEHFINDILAPDYFKEKNFDENDFNTVYIIGKDSYFTIFYYEIRHIYMTNFQPLNAVIISGKLDKENVVVTDTISHTTDTVARPIIRDFVMGIETMKYYIGGTSLDMILQFGGLATPGDLLIIKNDGIVIPEEYEE
jgi:hypothetical protein